MDSFSDHERDDSSTGIVVSGYQASMDELKAGATLFEEFLLRPTRYTGKEAIVRIQITSKLGGWKLKDELVKSIDLEVGDTVNAEIRVLYGPEIADDAHDADLFADGPAADWLIDTVLNNGGPVGCVVDCKVRFVYSVAPVGGVTGRMVGKASLVLVEGYQFVEHSHELTDALVNDLPDHIPPELLSKLLGTIG